jgi:hypothetical protein
MSAPNEINTNWFCIFSCTAQGMAPGKQTENFIKKLQQSRQVLRETEAGHETVHRSNSSKIYNKNIKCVATDLLTEIIRN